jgi:hypothetical protein
VDSRFRGNDDIRGAVPSIVIPAKAGIHCPRWKAREGVEKSTPVILSGAKDLGSSFRSDDMQKTAEMLRYAQHDTTGFFHTFRGFPHVTRQSRYCPTLTRARAPLCIPRLTMSKSMR